MNDPGYPKTGSGLLISFNPGKSKGFHLGALRTGSGSWIWRASPTSQWKVDGKGGVVSRDGSFDSGHGGDYPANMVVASGSSIIYGYHGEGWNGGQADQWMHFHESGLFLGQFGDPVYPDDNITFPKPAAAGNAFCPSLVTVGGKLYLWHNDESVHGGVHRWHIAGLDSIRIQVMSITG